MSEKREERNTSEKIEIEEIETSLFGGDYTGDPEVDLLVACGVSLPEAVEQAGYGREARVRDGSDKDE